MPYNILHNCDGAHQYVCVDGLSDCFYEWMLYYILHRFNGDHHYVCFDVLSDSSVDGIPYSILHSRKGDNNYVRGVVNKFPDWIFSARTERSYHSSR